ncbi:histone acetyltransferase [Ranunculus cassubicifolius]
MAAPNKETVSPPPTGLSSLNELPLLQLAELKDVIVHASSCRHANCAYRNCRNIKNRFRHMLVCKTRAAGGCILCKKCWFILQLHSHSCNSTTECYVPRCKALKEHVRMLQLRLNSVSTEPSGSAQPGNNLDQIPQDEIELPVLELEYLNLRDEMEYSNCF